MEKPPKPAPDMSALKIIRKSVSDAKPVEAVTLPSLARETPNSQADELSKLKEDLAFAESTVTAIKDRILNIESTVQKAERQRLVEHIQKHGISIEALLNDLGVRLPAPAPEEAPKPPKNKTFFFRNPETGDLHSGRGKNPSWLEMAKKEGREEEFRIPAEEMTKYNPHLQSA